MDLDELQVYRLAMEMGERIWAMDVDWDLFARDTVGKPFQGKPAVRVRFSRIAVRDPNLAGKGT